MKQITIIFKTHLDIGFTALAEDVTNSYPGYIHNAVATADYFRAKDPSPEGFRYRWTVGSWLVDEFFAKANTRERAFLTKAIRNGDIVWHAMPYTPECELMGLDALRAGLRRAADLDRRFGKRTHAAKMTDVPGCTRGVIGPFTEAGVALLHIGTNPGCGVCELPEAFRWRDAEGRELLVVYQTVYGSLLTLPDDTAFLISVAQDNHGAHAPETVEKLLADLRAGHPGARIVCGTLDDMADALDRHRASLPIVTSEIGSTWIHSAGTDPWKVSRYRECLRFAETLPSKTRERFLREIGIVAEHTGGLDTKTFLKDNEHWSGAEIRRITRTIPRGSAKLAKEAAKKDKGFAVNVRSWDEQREYIGAAAANLPAKARAALEARLAALAPHPASLRGSVRLEGSPRIQTRHFSFTMDSDRGALRDVRRADGTRLFSRAFLFSVEEFGPKDYDIYHRRYLRLHEWWTLCDFGKPGMPERPHRIVEGFPCEIRSLPETDGLRLLLREIPARGGLLRSRELEVHCPDSAPEMRVTLRVFGKEPERSAHALWLGFSPSAGQGRLSFAKLGERVDPTDVVPGGGRALHAIDGTVDLEGGASVESLDAPLLAPGVRDLLWRYRNRLPESGEPFHFNLYNNIWGCNFPMWFGDDMTYRFTLG